VVGAALISVIMLTFVNHFWWFCCWVQEWGHRES